MKRANLIYGTAFTAFLTLAAPLATAAEGATDDVKAALDTCAASVATDDNGRPDRTAMDACMTAAGFTKPLGRGGPRDNANAEGQYVDRAALEAALNECRSMVATDESGQPDRAAVDTCMEVKGFKKPAKEGRGPGRGRSRSGGGRAGMSVQSAK